ncbi:uncharacterized protein LOC135096197 [Scylla paramamosain]|uniref:uncharacterized protein LOC135096197 n=1 Tax=Scylla paramamosain TaxID=85552 RepID=UPI003082F35D
MPQKAHLRTQAALILKRRRFETTGSTDFDNSTQYTSSTDNSNSTDTLPTTTDITTTTEGSGGDELSDGAIAGIVIGSLAGVGLIIGGVYFMKKKEMLCFG